jgi:enolase-phosphatase E1
VPLPSEARCVLLDVEGTTTPIAFVHATLFPYARERLDAWCSRAGSDPRVAAALALLGEEHRRQPAAEDAPAFDGGAAYARWLMERDRKSTGLKALQGLIWEGGYATGELCAPVFADVPRALRAWRDAGIRMRVYSSGSVLAQSLLFAHTTAGDLTAFFEAYHDTTTGPKVESDSYRAIARDAGLAPAELLFLSDAPAELDAARAAGLRTGMLIRPGNPRMPAGSHPAHGDLLDLLPVGS